MEFSFFQSLGTLPDSYDVSNMLEAGLATTAGISLRTLECISSDTVSCVHCGYLSDLLLAPALRSRGLRYMAIEITFENWGQKHCCVPQSCSCQLSLVSQRQPCAVHPFFYKQGKPPRPSFLECSFWRVLVLQSGNLLWKSFLVSHGWRTHSYISRSWVNSSTASVN